MYRKVSCRTVLPVIAVIAISIAQLACSPIATATPTAAPTATKAPDPTVLNGTWHGTYICAQGITGLILTIANDGSTLDVVFDFQADKSNPNVPSGSYRMTGTFDQSSRKIELKATSWIDHPTGYFTVDLSGTVAPSNQSMTGNIIGPNCTTFQLQKTGR